MSEPRSSNPPETTQGSDLVGAVDIGTTKVCVAIGQRTPDGVKLLGLGCVPATGLKSGVAVEVETTGRAVAAAVRLAELEAGRRVPPVYVNVSQMNTRPPRPGPQLDQLDQPGRLHRLIQCVERAGLEVADLVPSAMASAQGMTTALDTQRGVAVVDIGAGTTDVAVFLDGALVRATALPVGGLHITTDLAQGLGVPLPEAERVKREYGDVLVRAEHAGAEVMVASGGGRPPRPCRRPDIVAIVEARATEILNAAAAVITRALMGETLNAGVLLCGGTARLRGMSELAQRQFQVPVREASPISLNPDQASALNDPACAVIVGLLAHVKPAGRSSLPPITGSSAHRAVFSA